MTEPQPPAYTDYSAWAGRLVFPTSPTDLTDTGKCPACLQPLRGATVCPACRLDLNHPAAGELRDLSSQAAQALLDRANLIGRMRYETHQRLAARAADTVPATPAPAPSASAAAPATAAPAVPEPASTPASVHAPMVASASAPAPAADAAAQASPPASAPPAASANQPRRSSVQVSLLVVGVSLLSIAAIFFLVYAFVMFGLVWRSLIIAAITVSAIAAATVLRNRNLTATGEGIAWFAVVLIYLDAWALKANDMFGLGAVNTTLYWGVVLLLTAVGFALWHRRTLLRAPNVAAFASLSPGLGLLAAGIAADSEPLRQSFIGFAAAGVAGVAYVATRHRRFERTVLLLFSLAATLTAAFIAPAAGPSETGSYGYGPIIAAGVAIIVLASLIRMRGPRFFTTTFAITAGVSTASAIALGGVRINSGEFWIFAPLISAVAVTLIGEALWRRATTQPLRSALGTATISAAVVAGMSALVPAAMVTFGAIFTSAEGLAAPWELHPTSELITRLPDEYPWALLAIAGAAVLAIVAAVLNKTLSASLPIALWALALGVAAAVPMLDRLDLVVSGWLALGALALVTLFVLRGNTAVRTRYRIILAALAGASLLLSLPLSWANEDLWWIATLVIIALLLFSRMLTSTPAGKASLLGIAALLVLAFSGPVASRISSTSNMGLFGETADIMTFTSIAAVLILLVSAAPLGRVLSALDRRVLFWTGLAGAVLVLGPRTLAVNSASREAILDLLLPEWHTSLALAVTLLVALLLWVFVPANRPLRAERIAASIAGTPALYLAVTAFTRALDLPERLDAVAPITAALLGAAASLTVTVLRPSSVPRWAREVGVAIVAVPAIVGALRTDTGLAWLALVLAGVTALLLAIDRDGLFTSASPRRHYGWLALALGTAGLWWRLRGDQVEALEPYVLPLAAALIVIGLLIQRASGSRAHAAAPGQDAPTPANPLSALGLTGPAVALAGALVALVPLGVNGATGPIERPIIVAAVSAALLLVGSWASAKSAVQGWLDAAALSGAVGLLVTVIGRVALTRDPIAVDAWVGALFVVLLAAAFAQAQKRTERPAVAQWRGRAGITIAIVALTAVLLFEMPQFDLRLGTVRALAVLLLFALVHLVAFIVDIKPLTPLVGWIAIAYAVIAGAAGTASQALDPLELATVPIAAALLTTGAHRLATVPEARSWPWLAPGLIVLLIPSLLATAQESPLWRLVALGIAAIAVLVVGVTSRLQAPFLIGGIVTLWHGIATFQPQLRAVYEAVPWWLWLGVGGILLIILAARYEKRIAGLKSAAMRFAALR